MEKRDGKVSVKLEEQYQPRQVYYGPRSPLPPPSGFACTAVPIGNVPPTGVMALASQSCCADASRIGSSGNSNSEQELKQKRKESSKEAARKYRKRRKAMYETLQESCKIKDSEIESLKCERDQLIEETLKLKTEIAFLKENQKEAIKILTNALQMSK